MWAALLGTVHERTIEMKRIRDHRLTIKLVTAAVIVTFTSYLFTNHGQAGNRLFSSSFARTSALFSRLLTAMPGEAGSQKQAGPSFEYVYGDQHC